MWSDGMSQRTTIVHVARFETLEARGFCSVTPITLGGHHVASRQAVRHHKVVAKPSVNRGGPAALPVITAAGHVSVTTDATDPCKTELDVVGTAGSDQILIEFAGCQNRARVMMNGTDLGTFCFTGRIVVHGLEGNDLITVDQQFTKPTLLVGGNGDNLIIGGSGPDLIMCGTGNDTLYGQAGNDTLISGGGHDRLFGGEGQNQLL
jgi:Ca2+-binding RTX toxin-like protein